MSSPPDTPGAVPEESSGGATLGAMLRHAREQRELSINDLAACLRLEPRIIERLEANEFDRLPAPAFIRGYVRSIAKQLDVDSAPLIAVFNLRFDDDAPGLNDFESRAPAEITSDSNVIRYTTIGLCIVMVLMVALWWKSHDFGLPSFTADDSAVQPVVPATPPLSYSFRQVAHPDDPFYRAPAPPPAPPAPAEPRAAQPAVADAVTPAVTADGPPAESGADTATATATATADIVIVTREDAWIEITDADGERLHYSIAKPGNEIRIDGKRPYTVVVGNAPAVTMRFDGDAVDVAALAVDGIAKFRLGEGAGDE